MTRSTYLPPGVYPDLSLEQYLAITDKAGWPAVSSGLLRSVDRGGRECQHWQRFGTEATKSMLAGSLAHIQILKPEDYLTRVVPWDEPVYEPRPALKWDKRGPDCYETDCGRYTLERDATWWCAYYYDKEGVQTSLQTGGTVTAGKRACKEHYERTVLLVPKLDADGQPKIAPQNPNSRAFQAFLAANPGREIVTRADIEQAKRIADAVRDNSEARRRLGQIWRTEYTIVWEDPETGALMKCRHDWLTDPVCGMKGCDEWIVTLGELKTCRSAEEGAFIRQAADMGYYCQAAHYADGFKAHFGKHLETESVCLAVENSGSHDSTVYTWEDAELDAGRARNKERLQRLLGWRDDCGTGQWPCRREAARISFEEHGRGHLLGDDRDCGLDMTGVERRN